MPSNKYQDQWKCLLYVKNSWNQTHWGGVERTTDYSRGVAACLPVHPSLVVEGQDGLWPLSWKAEMSCFREVRVRPMSCAELRVSMLVPHSRLCCITRLLIQMVGLLLLLLKPQPGEGDCLKTFIKNKLFMKSNINDFLSKHWHKHQHNLALNPRYDLRLD